MIRTPLEDQMIDRHIAGSLLLKARKEADSKSADKLAHFISDTSLISYPRDAVIFMEEPDDRLSNMIQKAHKEVHNNDYDLYGALLNGSTNYSLWDGKDIFELIKVFQEGAKGLNLNTLGELANYRPVAMQSPRLSGATLRKYRCGEEASKVYHFYMDDNGLALVTLRWSKDDVEIGNLYQDPRFWNNNVYYYLCSHADLPKLLSLCKDEELSDMAINQYDTAQVHLDSVKSDFDIEPKLIKSSIPLNEYGYTGRQTKHALEYICDEYYTGARSLSYISGLSLAAVSDLVDVAIDDELIESRDEVQYAGHMRLHSHIFETTVKGNALCMKRGNKRMKRAALNKHIKTVEGRYLEALACSDVMVTLPYVLGYFGSAINKDAKDYGDLDVFYMTLNSPKANKALADTLKKHPRVNPISAYHYLLCQAYERDEFPVKPVQIGLYESIENYAERVAESTLQRSSKLISVHELSEVLSIDAKFEVHYVGLEKLDTPITDMDTLMAKIDEFTVKSEGIAGGRRGTQPPTI